MVGLRVLLQISNTIGHRQSAEIITPIKVLLQSRVNSKGKHTQVSVTNITAAGSGEVKIRILNPACDNAFLMGQYTYEVKLSLDLTNADGIYEIVLNNLKPWAVTTLVFG